MILLFFIVLYSMVMISIFFFYLLHDSNSVFILFTYLDLNECAGPNECDLNALCTNTEGSYVCGCGKGFEGDGRNCTGINSCKTLL